MKRSPCPARSLAIIGGKKSIGNKNRMPTIKSTIDNTNGDYYVVTTTTDVEKGIDKPLPFEEGVEIPLATFENDLKKKKQPPSTPTTIASSSSDDTFINDTSNDGTKCCWSSWTTLEKTLALVATLAVLSVVFFFSILFTSKPTATNNNNSAKSTQQLQVQRIGNIGTPNNLFPLNKCRGDCDNDQECQQGLICYQRGSYEGVPGCLGGEVDGSGTDYCVVAVDDDDGKGASGNSRPINSPSSSTITQEPPTQPRDLFLLSGQSNMVGHTTSSESMTGSADYWNSIKSILDSYSATSSGGNLTIMEEQLYNVIYEANESNDKNSTSNDQVATTLTNGVMDLYKSGLLTDLDIPLQFGKCSFQEASDTKVYDRSRGTVPISSKSNCGHSFGHELLFARTMELAMNYTRREFELHKVARGGSGLYEHWYPNHGMHWDLLKSAIEEQKGQQGEWKGFVWHQGSQAAWSAQQYGEDRTLTYYGNLTGLVSEVRELMFQNSVTWRCKEEIPVVIVQVGYWPGYNNATRRTRDAQARFCTQDPRAVLVKTDDLSRFYHYDAASFLISGNRIAHAYQEALGGVVECPDDGVPSSSPSVKSMEPSMSLEPTVMRLETDLPSSISTNEPV